MEAHLTLAAKMELIFSTAKKVIADIPDVPSHLKENNKFHDSKKYFIMVTSCVMMKTFKLLV